MTAGLFHQLCTCCFRSPVRLMMLDCKPHFLIAISRHIFPDGCLNSVREDSVHKTEQPRENHCQREHEMPQFSRLTEDRDRGKPWEGCVLSGEGKQHFTYTAYWNRLRQTFPKKGRQLLWGTLAEYTAVIIALARKYILDQKTVNNLVTL